MSTKLRMALDNKLPTTSRGRYLECVYIERTANAGQDRALDDEVTMSTIEHDMPQPCQKAAGTGRHNIWTVGQRQAACLLYAIYANSYADLSEIFNSVFASELTLNGVQSGISPGALKSQIRDMKEGYNGHEIWKECFYTWTFDRLRIELAPIRNRIEDAGRCLGIQLRLRTVDHRGLSRSGHHLSRRKRKACFPRGVLGDEVALVFDTDEDETPCPKRKRHITETPRKAFGTRQPSRLTLSTALTHRLKTSGGSFLSNAEESGYKKQVPKLLYRFSDGNSQGMTERYGVVAGLFSSSMGSIPGPDEFGGKAFEDAVRTHLEPIKRSTPFVSFYDSLRPSLYRALRSSVQAYITIVDTAKATEAYKQRYGSEECCILWAKELVRKYKLKLRGKYTGPSEWLLWGSVPHDAVVSRFSMANFRIHVSSNPHLNDVFQLAILVAAGSASGLDKKFKYPSGISVRGIGTVVRDFLSFIGLPQEHYETAADRIYKKWNLSKAPYHTYLAAVLGRDDLEEVRKSTKQRMINVKNKDRNNMVDRTPLHDMTDEAGNQDMSDCIMVQAQDQYDLESSDATLSDEETSIDGISQWTGGASSLSSIARRYPWPPESSSVSQPEGSPTVSQYWGGTMQLQSPPPGPVEGQIYPTPATTAKESIILDLTQDEETNDVQEGQPQADLRQYESEWAFIDNEDSLTETSFETALED